MDNFNPINFINKLASNLNYSTNEQNPTSTRKAQNLTNKETINYSNTPKSNNAQANAYNNARLTPMENLRVSNMNLEQKANYVKELMQLPQELKDFLKQIAQLGTQNPAENAVKKLLATDLVKFATLTQVLKENSDTAMQKIFQMITNLSKSGASQNTAQLREMLNIIGASVATMGLDNSQTVKNLMLLYLPWLPLNANKNEHIDFNLDFFDDKDSNEAQDKSEHIEIVSIFIQTQNYANISATLEMGKEQKVTVLFKCSEDFPKEMFHKLFLENSKQEGVEAEVISQNTKQAVEKKAETTSVNMTAQSTISPYLLLMSYSLIRLVIQIDKENSENTNELHQQ